MEARGHEPPDPLAGRRAVRVRSWRGHPTARCRSSARVGGCWDPRNALPVHAAAGPRDRNHPGRSGTQRSCPWWRHSRPPGTFLRSACIKFCTCGLQPAPAAPEGPRTTPRSGAARGHCPRGPGARCALGSPSPAGTREPGSRMPAFGSRRRALVTTLRGDRSAPGVRSPNFPDAGSGEMQSGEMHRVTDRTRKRAPRARGRNSETPGSHERPSRRAPSHPHPHPGQPGSLRSAAKLAGPPGMSRRAPTWLPRGELSLGPGGGWVTVPGARGSRRPRTLLLRLYSRSPPRSDQGPLEAPWAAGGAPGGREWGNRGTCSGLPGPCGSGRGGSSGSRGA